MAGLSDFLLDPFGQLRGMNASMRNPPRPPGNIPPGANMQGVNPRLVAAVNGGATYLPPGYSIRAVSGMEGRTNPRSHHSKGNAGDWQIIKPDGTAIPHKGEDTTGMYTHLARGVKTWVNENDPSLAGKIGYGGAFGTEIGGGGVPDLMHYDLGGSRGSMRPKVQFALLKPLSVDERPTAVAGAAPGRPPPSGSVANARGAPISTEFAMNKLQKLGYNEAQSKAIVGNMAQESSLRPGSANTKEGAYGLMQWRGERFNQLQQFAQQKGTTWRDPNTQLEYIAHEMRNNPYERQQTERFRQATTVEDANAGMKSYLRYGDNSQDKRLTYAQRVQSPAGTVMAKTVTDAPAVKAIEQAISAPPPPQPLAYAPPAAPAAPTPAAPGLPPSEALGAGMLGKQQAGPSPAFNAPFADMGLRPQIPGIPRDIAHMHNPAMPSMAGPPELSQNPMRLTVNQPSPPAPLPRPRPLDAPRAPQPAPAASSGGVTGRSALAQSLIDAWNPHPQASGGQLTTFIERGTGNEIISGSVGDQNIYRNLGKTGAGQPIPAPQQTAPTSLRQAVEQAVAPVPLPRPRPPEAPGIPPAIGLTHPGAIENGRKITPYDISHPGAVVWPETAGPRPGSREFSPMPSALQPAPPPPLNGGYTTTQQNPQNNMLFAPGNRLSMRDPSPNSVFAQPSPFSPAMQPPVTPPPPPPAFMPPQLQWWQQPGVFGGGGFGGFGGGGGFGMPGTSTFDFAGGSFGGL